MARARRFRIITIVTLMTVVAMVAGLFAAFGGNSGGGSVPSDASWDLQGQPFLGPEDASVTVVEFGDYKCPHCKLFDELVFPQIKAEYIDTGKIKYYHIHFPFLAEDSLTAAAAARAVYDQDPQAFWRYHRAIFAVQQDMRTEWATPEFLVQLAEEVVPEIDSQALAVALEQGTYVSQVQADLQLGQAAGVRGTPSVFVNGHLLSDASFESVSAAIERELAQAGGS